MNPVNFMTPRSQTRWRDRRTWKEEVISPMNDDGDLPFSEPVAEKDDHGEDEAQVAELVSKLQGCATQGGAISPARTCRHNKQNSEEFHPCRGSSPLPRGILAGLAGCEPVSSATLMLPNSCNTSVQCERQELRTTKKQQKIEKHIGPPRGREKKYRQDALRPPGREKNFIHLSTFLNS